VTGHGLEAPISFSDGRIREQRGPSLGRACGHAAFALLLTSGAVTANFYYMPSRALERTISWCTHKGLLLKGTIAVTTVAIAVVIMLARGNASSEPREMLLADGTQIVLLNGTRALPAKGFPKTREIQLQGEGEVFIKARQQDRPLIVRTGLMVLTVEGDSAFRGTVSSEQIGEQAEVLYGHVRAAKAYASQFNEPDVLVGGEMSMVNRSIDLMEKETFDRAELARWSNAVVAAAARHRVADDP
jgi:ferric-dicitrate binding protein FerR (iron transport regulator)